MSAKSSLATSGPEEVIRTESLTKMYPGDVLAVAGKGHEQGQIVGDTVLPFDDVDAVRVALGGARG